MKWHHVFTFSILCGCGPKIPTVLVEGLSVGEPWHASAEAHVRHLGAAELNCAEADVSATLVAVDHNTVPPYPSRYLVSGCGEQVSFVFIRDVGQWLTD
jgi:hypothetical protein